MKHHNYMISNLLDCDDFRPPPSPFGGVAFLGVGLVD